MMPVKSGDLAIYLCHKTDIFCPLCMPRKRTRETQNVHENVHEKCSVREELSDFVFLFYPVGIRDVFIDLVHGSGIFPSTDEHGFLFRHTNMMGKTGKAVS